MHLSDDIANLFPYTAHSVTRRETDARTIETGWRVNEENGSFIFDDLRHFPYTKIVLGKIILNLKWAAGLLPAL